MARVTVEDCIDKVENRFELVLIASHRARMIAAGAPIMVDRDNDKNPVVALREIAEFSLGARRSQGRFYSILAKTRRGGRTRSRSRSGAVLGARGRASGCHGRYAVRPDDRGRPVAGARRPRAAGRHRGRRRLSSALDGVRTLAPITLRIDARTSVSQTGAAGHWPPQNGPLAPIAKSGQGGDDMRRGGMRRDHGPPRA